MRKQNPNDVVAEFTDRLDKDLDRWRAQSVLLKGDLLRNSAVDAFFRAATAFEGYRSDWHVAAINRDSSVLRARLGREVENALKRSTYPGLVGHTTAEIPEHPSLQIIRDLVDPQGAHLSFGQGWVERSQKELSPAYSDKVTRLPPADLAFIKALVALRNFIAHRSVRASNEFHQARLGLDAATDGELSRGLRRIHPSGVGSYLNARRGGVRRVELYFTRLSAIARRMSV